MLMRYFNTFMCICWFPYHI